MSEDEDTPEELNEERITNLMAEIDRLRGVIESVRDRLKHEANAPGGIADCLDFVLSGKP